MKKQRNKRSSLFFGILTVTFLAGRRASAFHLRHAVSRQRVTTSIKPFAANTNEAESRSLYRPIAEMAWNVITESFPELSEVKYDESLKSNFAKNVRIETRALRATKGPVRYARLALLEAPSAPQVLNLVVFPDHTSDWPVWSCDFVSLPGGRHLLLLDAQPMNGSDEYAENWRNWHQIQDIASRFPWGGDMPEAVQQYVSKFALWTRFGQDVADPIERIESHLIEAAREHLNLYVKLLSQPTTKSTNQQPKYIEYRLTNDPAKPMLKSLYGEEWTERVLKEVLFPKST